MIGYNKLLVRLSFLMVTIHFLLPPEFVKNHFGYITSILAILGFAITLSNFLQKKAEAVNEYTTLFFINHNITNEIISKNQNLALEFHQSKTQFIISSIINFHGNNITDDDEKSIINEFKKMKNHTDNEFQKGLNRVLEETGVDIITIDILSKKINYKIHPFLIKRTQIFSHYKFFLKGQIYSLKIYRNRNNTRIIITKDTFLYFKIQKKKGIGVVSASTIQMEILTAAGKQKNYTFYLDENNIKEEQKGIFVDIVEGNYSNRNDYELLSFTLEFVNQYGVKVIHNLSGTATFGFNSQQYMLTRGE